MDNIYTNGRYLEASPTWSSEDSPWKADQIKRIIENNRIQPKRIAEIGCGAGYILDELSKFPDLQGVYFEGYDISPQAIEIAKEIENKRIQFFHKDFLSEKNEKKFDILLVIDVFEHVSDYMGFVAQCRTKAKYKIFHIPLDIHVSSVVRRAFTRNRNSIGHLHYFTAESAICTLEDTGHRIIDSFFTSGAIGLFREHPTMKKAGANLPRWLFSRFSVPLAARLFGGYSLLVLAE